MLDDGSSPRERIIPKPMDILLGRGKSFRRNPGNVAFAELIRSNRLSYSESHFEGKKAITTNIIQSLQTNGRFLRLIDNKWVLISDREIRQKIAHAIHYRIRATVPKQELTSQPATTPITDNSNVAVVGTSEAQELPVVSTSISISSRIPYSFTTNQQPYYNDSDTFRTLDLSQQVAILPYPFHNDNMNYERQMEPFNLPQNVAPTYHHGFFSNMMFHRTTQLPPISFGTCVVGPISPPAQQGASIHPMEHSYDTGIQYHHHHLMADSSQSRCDLTSTTNHKLPSPPSNQNSEAALTCTIPATSTTFDTLDSSINSIPGSTSTPDIGTLLTVNVFDQGIAGNNTSPSNVKQPPSPRPVDIQYENGSMNRDTTGPRNFAYNNESTIGKFWSPSKIYGDDEPASSGMYSPFFFPLPSSLSIPDGPGVPIQPSLKPCTRRMDDTDTIGTIGTDTISSVIPKCECD